MLRTLRFIWNHPVSSANRIAAYSRYMRWQLGSRLLRAPVVMPFVDKTFLVVERSMTGATGNLYCGLHEFCDMGFLLHFLREDDLFVDIGANIGSYTVLASGVVRAHSIAIEPVPNTFARLKRNIRVNDIESYVEEHRIVAGAKSGLVRFSVDRDCVNQVVDEDYLGESVDVPVVAMDDILRHKSPVLWKVDVEGYELEVLKGATNSLNHPALKAVLLEAESPEIVELMCQAGFQRAHYDPLDRCLQPFSGESNPSRRGNVNNLWIRDIEAVRERCQSSRVFSVYGKEF